MLFLTRQNMFKNSYRIKNLYNSFVKLKPINQRYFCNNHNRIDGIKSIETIHHLLQEQASESQLYQINGWIRGKIQKKKSKWFLHLDDGTTPDRLQIIIPQSLIQESNSKINNGTSLQCIGKLIPSVGSQQSIELYCESFRIIGECPSIDYQIGHLKTGMELDFLREQIHLRPRIKYFQSILRIRNELTKAIHRFMNDNRFIEVNVPLITANDCEGGGECFTLKPINWPDNIPNDKLYFGRPTYLSVSGQLHLEALASSLSRVYTLSPVFRAEKSMSPKHLSEFLMLELEQAFLFDLNPLIDRVESLIKYLIKEVEQNCSKDLQFLLDKNDHEKYFEKLKNSQFIRITYQEACKILSEKYPQLNHSNLNLNAEMERTLLKILDYCPVFVTEFPMELKPFYMKSNQNNNDNVVVAECFDLLTPICGEVCGGSLRENNLNKLIEQINLKKMSTEQLQWYLDLRKFGSSPSGGFGLGFDRFIQTLCGVKNIKDVVPFPRWPYHCYL